MNSNLTSRLHIHHKYVILVKCGCFGGISEMPLLGQSVSSMYIM
jgi:hypothetical protein